MDSDEMNSMYAQIVNGGAKTESRFVTDDESSALWDQIEGEVNALRADGVEFEVPHEVPGQPGTPSGRLPAPGEKAPDDKPAPAAPADEDPPEDPEAPADEDPEAEAPADEDPPKPDDEEEK